MKAKVISAIGSEALQRDLNLFLNPGHGVKPPVVFSQLYCGNENGKITIVIFYE